MQIVQTEVMISTPRGQMPAFLCTPTERFCKPAVILLRSAFGVHVAHPKRGSRHCQRRLRGSMTDLYYRELPNNKFGYDSVEQARAMMYSLDIKFVEEDIQKQLADVKSRPDVYPDKVGVTGFCFGGGLSFMVACKLSDAIAAAAFFYGMVFDE